MLYFAYGSNLHHFQMKKRCKDSIFLKKINLKDFRLTFRSKYRAADIEPKKNSIVPGAFNHGRQKMAWMPENAKLILNPTSGAPGFNVENVFSLPGVPSILKSMLGGLTNRIVGGKPIKSLTISLRTVESEIANSLTKVQNNNTDVEIGSYPFFHAGKLGVSIVIRSEDQNKIDDCNSQILKFINEKNIEVVDR